MAEEKISSEEYWKQIFEYSSHAVNMAKGDASKLIELAAYFKKLPEDAALRLLDELESKTITKASDSERYALWKTLQRLKIDEVNLSENLSLSKRISRIKDLIKKLAPKDPALKHKKLFSYEKLDFETSDPAASDKRTQIRQSAIKDIYESGGINGVLEFSKTVETPGLVGAELARLSLSGVDSQLLPSKINQPEYQQLLSAFVRERYLKEGEDWLRNIVKGNWTIEQKALVLTFLPFKSETWRLVAKILGKGQDAYWSKVNPNPFEVDMDLEFVIDKLLDCGKAILALSCLTASMHRGEKPDMQLAVKVLNGLLTSGEEFNTMTNYNVIKVIKHLQNSSEIEMDTLLKVEWGYLQLLEHEENTAPKLLEQHLASHPEFFCQLIQSLYFSKNEQRVDKTPTAKEESFAKNAYILLDNWRTPPGLKDNQVFDPKVFQNYLKTVQRICKASGHLDVAMIQLGSVLFHAPADPDGFWIHRSVATELDKLAAEKLRKGYAQEAFNSRGVYWVDTTGQDDLKLAEKYFEKATALENEGFSRFSVTLRNLGEYYESEAKKMKEDPEYW